MPRNFISGSHQRNEAAKRKEEERRAEAQKRATEKRWWHPKNWNWTAVSTCVIALFTIGIFVVGIYQWRAFRGQLDVMQGQLDEMEADQRPWVSVTPEITRPIMFSDWNGKGVSVVLTFSLKNYGRSPARNITVRQHIVPHPGNAHANELDQPQRQLCFEATQGAEENHTAGITIFPDDTRPVEQGAGTGNNLYVTEDSILFSVQGCVDYTYSANRHGRVTFRYLLGKVAGNRWGGLPFKIGTPPANAPAGLTTAYLDRDAFDFGEDPSGGNYTE